MAPIPTWPTVFTIELPYCNRTKISNIHRYNGSILGLNETAVIGSITRFVDESQYTLFWNLEGATASVDTVEVWHMIGRNAATLTPLWRWLGSPARHEG